ncbi:hypothetical protein SDC9_105218 [bioreactor metagenome]|uniref:Uracil-DNA glycosylase-like domain-containing protein n=1 Tax=bioreactor metagenome TaxID=1076179 RepID=A0A645AYZ3_9ZZZZ|nr:hypothetical protein [Paludibacter sp.]
MNINQKLALYYASRWSALCKALDSNELYSYEYNPLLLNTDNSDDFESADIKVMLFGQDMSAGDWYMYDRVNLLDEKGKLSPKIKTFNNKTGACNVDGKRQTRGMGGGMNLFIDRLNDKFKDKKVRYVWNDIVKIGRNVEGNQKKVILEDIENQYFDVVKDEINIIQPQVIVFFTGPTIFWESRLQKKLGISKDKYNAIPNWNNIRQVALLDFDNEQFPSVQYAFRTYHPCARASKKARYDAIIENIKL